MAKDPKKITKKPQASKKPKGKYHEKVVINATFGELIKMAASGKKGN